MELHAFNTRVPNWASYVCQDQVSEYQAVISPSVSFTRNNNFQNGTSRSKSQSLRPTHLALYRRLLGLGSSSNTANTTEASNMKTTTYPNMR